jgi:hypothetical protein
MQQFSSPSQNEEFGSLRKRLIGISSGVVLFLAAIALVPLVFLHYLNSYLAIMDGFLLYVLVPLIPSFYISRRTRQRRIGFTTGHLAGITGAILMLIALGAYFLFAALKAIPLPPGSVDAPYFRSAALLSVFAGFAFADGLAYLLAVCGAEVGSFLGTPRMPPVKK